MEPSLLDDVILGSPEIVTNAVVQMGAKLHNGTRGAFLRKAGPGGAYMAPPGLFDAVGG